MTIQFSISTMDKLILTYRNYGDATEFSSIKFANRTSFAREKEIKQNFNDYSTLGYYKSQGS